MLVTKYKVMNKLNLISTILLLGVTATSSAVEIPKAQKDFGSRFIPNITANNNYLNNPPWENKVRFYSKQIFGTNFNWYASDISNSSRDWYGAYGEYNDNPMLIKTSKLGYISASLEVQFTLIPEAKSPDLYQPNSTYNSLQGTNPWQYPDYAPTDLNTDLSNGINPQTRPDLNWSYPMIRGEDNYYGQDHKADNNATGKGMRYGGSWIELSITRLLKNNMPDGTSFVRRVNLENSIGAGGDLTEPVNFWLNVGLELTNSDGYFSPSPYSIYKVNIQSDISGMRYHVIPTNSRLLVETA